MGHAQAQGRQRAAAGRAGAVSAACQLQKNPLYSNTMSTLRQANALFLLASLLLAGLLLRLAR
jgi:hypothetical protein